MVAAYARLLARYPLAVLVCTLSVCIACMVSVILTTEWPDFSNPIKGFETRGTEISQRSLALKNLRLDLDHLRGQNNVFYRYPDEFALAKNSSKKDRQPRSSRVSPESETRFAETKYVTERATRSDNGSATDRFKKKDENRKGKKMKVHEVDPRKPLSYCNTTPSQSSSGDDYAMIAFEVAQDSDLFSMATFSSLCEAEQRLWSASVSAALAAEGENADADELTMSAFMPRDSCQVATKRRCCQPWHLASVAAYLLDKPDCSHLNESDVQWMKSKVDYCQRYARNLFRCWTTGDGDCLKTVPANCSSQAMNLVYQYLLPKEFATNETTTEPAVTLMVLPVPKTAYKDLTLKQVERLPSFVSGDKLRLVAMDFGVRDTMFQQYLLKDTIFGVFALILVFVAMWIYSGSFLFTLAAMIGIDLSLGLAYFVYRVVFAIEFFPFMNLLTYVLIIGVGADDAFIFRSAWMKAKFDKNSGTHAKILSDTLSHAAVSMFVTSLTTAAAFYTNIFSQIIAVKCFGIFAGTTILTNYLLVITWLPACVVLSEKRPIFSTSYCWCCPRWCIRQQRRHLNEQERRSGSVERRRSSVFGIDSNAQILTSTVSGSSFVGGSSQNHRLQDDDDESPTGRVRGGWNTKKIWALLTNPAQRRYQELTVFGRVFFQKLLPWLVIKLRFVWLVVFGVVAVLSAVAVFYKPALKLPSKDYFQYFKPAHPFERWEDGVKQRFAFGADNSRIPLLMYVVWGVRPTIDARIFDPDDLGTVQAWPTDGHSEFFDNLNLLWLRDFCSSIAVQNFTRFPSEMPMLASCFVDTFMTVMRQRPCTNPGTGQSQWPCCADVHFPYPPGVFETCLEQYITLEKPTITLFDLTSGLGPSGPLFSAESGKPSGLVVMFTSKYNFTFSYSAMHEFYESANTWVTDRLRSGPSAVRNGWLVADHLQLYDLQRALTSGTRLSVLIALAIAFGVLFITTWNPLISFLAILSISSIIVTTIAVLILLDWELNVLESTIIILTIGLSFDFTLHYGVAYKLCQTADDRESRVIYALGEVGTPVFMAFVTTFLAGVAMLPSTTLAYFQIGLFMILETSISWLYATFFFISLLHCVGPSGQSCQLNPRHFRCSTRKNSGSAMAAPITGAGRRISRDIATDAALAAAARRKKSSIVSFNAVAFNTVSCSQFPNAVVSAKLSTFTAPDYSRLDTRRPITVFKSGDRSNERNHREPHQESVIVETEPMITDSPAHREDTPELPAEAETTENAPQPEAEENSRMATVDGDQALVPTDSEVAQCSIPDEPSKRQKKPSLKERAVSVLGPVLHRFSVKRQPTKEATIEMNEQIADLNPQISDDDPKEDNQHLHQDVPFIDGDSSMQNLHSQAKVSLEETYET